MDDDEVVLAGQRFEVMLVIVVDKIGDQKYQAAPVRSTFNATRMASAMLVLVDSGTSL
jgi:hypothetical protein